jgi:hypothetical protein
VPPGKKRSALVYPSIHELAANNITGKRYIYHWREAGFECDTPIKNTEAGAAMMRIEAARRVFPRCWFNEATTEAGLGNCGSCRWVLAEGVIEVGTTEKFKAFVTMEMPPRNIRFNSPGGILIEALKFGEFLRMSGWNTFVSEESATVTGSHVTAYKTQRSKCYSACVYVFAGEVHRTAENKALGVHQFYRPDDALRPNDKSLSALDMANMQRTAALLNEYVRQMGVDPRLVSIASAITPWQSIYLLSSAKIASLNLDTNSSASVNTNSDWSVQPSGNGAIALTTQAQDGTSAIFSKLRRRVMSGDDVQGVAVPPINASKLSVTDTGSFLKHG